MFKLIEKKYKIHSNPLNLEVKELLDFQDEPILNLEINKLGDTFISYLIGESDNKEKRIIVQVGKERLAMVLNGEISIKEIFSTPELEIIYACEFDAQDGNCINTYVIPSKDFVEINPIKSSYIIKTFDSISLDEQRIIDYAQKKEKAIFDLYVQSENMENSIKPYAIYDVLMPIVGMLKVFLGIKQADEYFGFSNIRQGSLGITIEIDYSKDIDLNKIQIGINQISQLLNAHSYQELKNLQDSNIGVKKSYYSYTKVINAVEKNKANLFTAYTDPFQRHITKSKMDFSKAHEISKILKEHVDMIEKITKIEGQLYGIDIDKKTVHIKGRADYRPIEVTVEEDVVEKLKKDKLSIGKGMYLFTLRESKAPKSALVKSGKPKYTLVAYQKN